MRIVIVISTALILAACNQSPGYAPLPQDPGRVVRIDMSDFAFSPATISVKPGERITLSFRNMGGQEHEFMAGRDATVGKGFMRDWLALAKVETASGAHAPSHTGDGLRIPPRGAANVTVVVPPDVGEFEFACFVVGHYESGMKGTLIVDAGVAPNAVPTVAPTLRPAAAPSASHTMEGEDAEQH
jgi:uncharacterized cupredoxin-like copper-binding protein